MFPKGSPPVFLPQIYADYFLLFFNSFNSSNFSGFSNFSNSSSSESAFEVDPELEGTALLRESSVHRFKVEGLVVFVQRVVYPEADLAVALVQADAAVEYAVERLAGVVLLCPVDTSRRTIVGVDRNVVQPCTFAQSEYVLSACGECVLRDEGHVVSVVVFRVAQRIVSEGGVCVSVAAVQTERVRDL